MTVPNKPKTYNGYQLVQHGIEGWRALETELEQ